MLEELQSKRLVEPVILLEGLTPMKSRTLVFRIRTSPRNSNLNQVKSRPQWSLMLIKNLDKIWIHKMVNPNNHIKALETKDLLALPRFSSRGSKQVILLHLSSHHQVIKTASNLVKDWNPINSMVSKVMETVRKICSSPHKDSIKTSSKCNQGGL